MVRQVGYAAAARAHVKPGRRWGSKAMTTKSIATGTPPSARGDSVTVHARHTNHRSPVPARTLAAGRRPPLHTSLHQDDPTRQHTSRTQSPRAGIPGPRAARPGRQRALGPIGRVTLYYSKGRSRHGAPGHYVNLAPCTEPLPPPGTKPLFSCPGSYRRAPGPTHAVWDN